MNNKQNILEALVKARDLISEPNRFAQGWFAFDSEGNPVAHPTNEKACAWCALGACWKIADESHGKVNFWELESCLLDSLDPNKAMPNVTQINDIGGHYVTMALFTKTIERLSK